MVDTHVLSSPVRLAAPAEPAVGRVARVRSYGHEVGTLRCPGYLSMTMIAATFTKARKLAFFS